MKAAELFKEFENKELTDKIYGFAYRRCDTSEEAEDLSQDIITEILSAALRQTEISNFYAFVWTVARRVYADFCENRRRGMQNCIYEDFVGEDGGISELLEDISAAEEIKRIFGEIAFLSRAYREATVMYYIDGRSVKEIAAALGIGETTVKQRLFYSRNTLRKEVKAMKERNLTLKPKQLVMFGMGHPIGNNPAVNAVRLFSQNLIYLCKDTPKTAKELSEELCVPMLFVEEELYLQCYGENGRYGMLKKLENGRYVSNIIIVDYDEYDAANKVVEQYLPEFCSAVEKVVEQNREKLLSFPFLSPQQDTGFILWILINEVVWSFRRKIVKLVSEEYMAGIKQTEREYSLVAVAIEKDSQKDLRLYGCDGISAENTAGFRSVFIQNGYNNRLERHFACGHNISTDGKLLMLLRSIGGLKVSELNESEKEIAAKAVECGYIRRSGDILEPAVVVIDRKNQSEFYSILKSDIAAGLAEQAAEKLAEFVKSHLPERLINDYQIYMQLIAGARFMDGVVEECIKCGILTDPKCCKGAASVLVSVEK